MLTSFQIMLFNVKKENNKKVWVQNNITFDVVPLKKDQKILIKVCHQVATFSQTT